MQRMAEAVAGDMQRAAVVASVVCVVDIEVVEAYLPSDMRNTMLEEAVPGTLVVMDPYFAQQAQLAKFAPP